MFLFVLIVLANLVWCVVVCAAISKIRHRLVLETAHKVAAVAIIGGGSISETGVPHANNVADLVREQVLRVFAPDIARMADGTLNEISAQM